ncbi:MAG: hypothetical protein LZF60_330027 [Nitrospira sp.]|nr:MAG: hypothetical protein LZF60_330027 [Nitrospira sp.]
MRRQRNDEIPVAQGENMRVSNRQSTGGAAQPYPFRYGCIEPHTIKDRLRSVASGRGEGFT